MYFRGVLVSAWSRTQPVVALSTAEAELIAMTMAVQEGQFLQHLLTELNVETKIHVYSDSSAARAVVARRGCGRMKHLQVRDLWLQDQLRDGRIEVRCVGTDVNPADMFTKVFAKPRHERLATMLGVRRDSETGEKVSMVVPKLRRSTVTSGNDWSYNEKWRPVGLVRRR